MHRKNLDTSSEGFSPPDSTSSQDEIVRLTEDGATLDLLFQYMYPQRQPDLSMIAFKRLAELAEAAEKYQVYAAMEICRVRMGYVVFVPLSALRCQLTSPSIQRGMLIFLTYF